MEAALRANYVSYGSLTDAQWRKMALDSARKRPKGGYGFAYDPRIGDPFKAGPVSDVDLWPVWDGIERPTCCCAAKRPTCFSATSPRR